MLDAQAIRPAQPTAPAGVVKITPEEIEASLHRFGYSPELRQIIASERLLPPELLTRLHATCPQHSGLLERGEIELELVPQGTLTAFAGVPPRVMGIGPVPATRRLLGRLGLTLADMDVNEINEAFAVQALTCMRELGIADDDSRVNPQGGAIALGHPLGMSGARLVLTAAHQLRRTGKRRALCTMCVGVGQGIAIGLERC